MKDWLASNRDLLIRLAGSLLALGMLIFLLASVWSDLLESVSKVSIWHLLGAAGLILLSRFSTVGRWYVLLRTGGVKIPLSQALSLTFTGLFASHFLPTTIGGDVLRLAGAVRLGYDRAVCLASIAADRLVGMAGMTVILPLGLLPVWDARATLLLSPLAFAPRALWTRGVEFVQRTFGVMTLWLRQPLSLLGAFGFTFGHMLFTFLAVLTLIDGLGESMAFWLVAGLWSVAYFITLIPISINGYGLQELSMTVLYSQVGGLSLPASLAVAVLIRLVTTLASLPGALFLPAALADMALLKKN